MNLPSRNSKPDDPRSAASLKLGNAHSDQEINTEDSSVQQAAGPENSPESSNHFSEASQKKMSSKIDLNQHKQDYGLVQRSLQKNEIAIEQLIERLNCVPKILHVVSKKVANALNKDDLVDLSQDVLILVWKKRQDFRGQSKLESWVYGICFYEFMNKNRRLIREQKKTASAQKLEAVPAPTTNTQHLLFASLEAALNELGPPESDVIRLKHFDRLSFTQLAKILDLSANTAKTHYYRGIKFLKSALGSTLDGATL